MIPCRLIFCKTRVRCGKLESVAPVAQWIRASVFGTEGRGFESLRVYHRGVRVSLGLFFVIKNRAEYILKYITMIFHSMNEANI